MRKINKTDVAKIMLVLALVAGIGLAFGSVGVGRFTPTHMIVKSVYCGSCHPEQVQELSKTTHIQDFSRDIEYAAYKATSDVNGNNGTYLPAAEAVSKGCQMCHNYWENFKWFGVRNFTVSSIENDNPNVGQVFDGATDIYGNAVSPYGLGSTTSYMANVSSINDKIIYHRNMPLDVEPWTAGLDTYYWNDTNTGTKHYRLDYVWSQLSALSPGPVGWQVLGQVSTKTQGCGSAEKGMCHLAIGAVVSEAIKQEIPEYPNGTNYTNDSWSYYNNANRPATALGAENAVAGTVGGGIFFTHEMAFTTAQYAAKPVKICGACHVFKLPPMKWGGEPWAISDIETANDNNGTVQPNTDPFGFGPTYNDLTGEGLINSKGLNTSAPNWPEASQYAFRVAFKTPDWAHANVPCIRCHVHAGVNGETVSNNVPENNSETTSYIPSSGGKPFGFLNYSEDGAPASAPGNGRTNIP